MIEQLPRYALIFFLLVVSQVLVFNNIYVGNFLNVFPYVLFIFILPSNANRALQLVLAFLIGITIDLFSDSGGIHAAACVPVAYIRSFILRTTASGESTNDTFVPDVYYFGLRRYLTYAGILMVLHHSILFFLEAFELGHFFSTILKIAGSTLMTLTFIVLIQYIFIKNKEK